MKNTLKLGLVVADEMEYLPVRELSSNSSGNKQSFYTREGHQFTIVKGDKTIEIQSVLCGIGKVNAAAATMFLAQKNVDLIVNFGLSGGICGVQKGDIVIGDTFLEHDFNLTTIGYQPAEKPGQDYVYHADPEYLEVFSHAIPTAKIGAMVSGDCFVCDNNLREQLKTRWKAVACDMETAAVAYVATLSNLPFVCIRQVSDDAGDDAYGEYKQMNESSEVTLFQSVLSGIDALFSSAEFWK